MAAEDKDGEQSSCPFNSARLQIQNEPTYIVSLSVTEQEVHDSTRAATDPYLEAPREGTVMAEPEEEYLQQVRDDLMAVVGNCLKGFEPEGISMPKPDYTHQEVTAKENPEGLNNDVASLKPQHNEQKEPKLLEITREDHLEVKHVGKTASVIHSTTCKEHAVISLGQVPIEQHSVIALSTAECQSQCALGMYANPPSHVIPPVHRIEWWIEFVKSNHSKVDCNSSGLFMSSILNPKDACLILRRFMLN